MSKRLFITLVAAVVLITTLLVVWKNSNRDVLDAFEDINEKLEQSNRESNVRLYYGYKTGFDSFEESAEQLDTFIEELKDQIRDRLIDHDLEAANGESVTDYILLDGDEPSQRGLELIAEISSFRATFYEDFNELYPDLVKECDELFSTDPVVDRDGSEENWLVYNFDGFPSVAVMAKLSQFQTDINYLRDELLFLEEE